MQRVSMLETQVAQQQEELRALKVESSQRQEALDTALLKGAQLQTKLAAAEEAKIGLSDLCFELEGKVEEVNLAREDMEARLGEQITALQQTADSLGQELRNERQVVTQLRSEVIVRQERALEAERLKEKTEKEYWDDCLHSVRTAAYHALPDFDWAPVKRLLNKYESHPKVEALLLEEAGASLQDAEAP